MSYRVALLAGVLTACAASYCEAGIEATDSGIQVRAPSVPAPTRGMTKAEVTARFGEPTAKSAPVGKPPITRWEYPGYTVFFEYDHVVHAVAQ
jgi:hypothetical protein